MANELLAIITDDLGRAWGGVQMRLTQYGYRNDPYMDSETRKGHGAYRHLERDVSVALTDSALASLGLSRKQVRHQPFYVDLRLKGGGVMTRRIDDRAPERNRRVDLYNVSGFNRHLPDYADVVLHGRR